MIKSFYCTETQSIFKGTFSHKFPHDIQKVARRKLRMLNNAVDLNDLRAPPGNRLESLKGNRKGQHSIRINKQWRICFHWKSGHAYHVAIIDYH